MKIGCIIQGDVRRGTRELLETIPLKFDFTVLSTWECESDIALNSNYSVVLSEKPKVI